MMKSRPEYFLTLDQCYELLNSDRNFLVDGRPYMVWDIELFANGNDPYAAVTFYGCPSDNNDCFIVKKFSKSFLDSSKPIDIFKDSTISEANGVEEEDPILPLDFEFTNTLQDDIVEIALKNLIASGERARKAFEKMKDGLSKEQIEALLAFSILVQSALQGGWIGDET